MTDEDIPTPSMHKECKYPFLPPSTSYNSGCRCKVCCKYRIDKHLAYYWENGGKDHQKEWRANNVHIVNFNSATRRAKINESKVKLTESEKEEIRNIYKKCHEISESTGIPHHVDHIFPVSQGGIHHPSNLQILTAKANLSKGAKIL
jgi:hypothetical protein